MKIATVLNVHSDSQNIIDTCHSIFEYSGPNVLLLVNGSKWNELKNLDVPAYKVRGFRHDMLKASYRNVALGLKMVQETFPDADWFCFTEPNALFASSRFKNNLLLAEDRNVWMLGSGGHVAPIQISLVEAMFEKKFKSVYYLLGGCLFFHKDFMNKLSDIDFFDRFLFLTNSFSDGFFPDYKGLDISEHLYPTLCRHLGGNVGVFSTWDNNQWHGASQYFPMRCHPEIEEEFPEASILYPLKEFLHPTRKFHRERRNNGKL